MTLAKNVTIAVIGGGLALVSEAVISTIFRQFFPQGVTLFTIGVISFFTTFIIIMIALLLKETL